MVFNFRLALAARIESLADWVRPTVNLQDIRPGMPPETRRRAVAAILDALATARA